MCESIDHHNLRPPGSGVALHFWSFLTGPQRLLKTRLAPAGYLFDLGAKCFQTLFSGLKGEVL